MADFIIDGGADTFWIAFIVEVGGNGAVAYSKVVNQAVNFSGTHAYMDFLRHHVQHCCVDFSAGADAFQFFDGTN